jgi:alanyl-tRNA synthetase
MNATETIRIFLEFFGDRGHQVVPGSSLVPPEGDPVLFTTAGMHPLTRYLEEGRPPPAGQAANRRTTLPAHHRSGRGRR